MEPVTLTIALLVFAASLASWLLSQALLHRKREAATGLVVGTAATSCLLAAAGAMIVAAPFWLQSAPVQVDLTSPSIRAFGVAAEAPPTEPDLGELDPSEDAPTSAATSGTTIKVSRQVGEPLKRAQEAMRRKDWTAALENIQAAAAVPERSSVERFQVAQFATYVHLQLRDYAAAATAAAEQLQWMDPASADYERVLKVAAQLDFQSKRYSRSVDYARQYLERHAGDVEMRVLLAQAHYLSGEYSQARNEIDAAIDAQTQLRGEIPESWLAIKLTSTGQSGDMHAMERLRQELLQNYPQHERAFARTARQRDIVVSEEGAAPVTTTLLPVRNDVTDVWQATDCVKTAQDDAASLRSIRNLCGRAVGVLFARCEHASARCSGAREGAWQYDQGMLLIGKPDVESRSGDSDLLSHTRVVDGSARIRYLACFVATGPAELSRDSIEELWQTDECLRRVSRWIAAGRDGGKSPDMLLDEARRDTPTFP